MKKTKIISLLLTLTLLVGVANPAALAIEARAADGTTSRQRHGNQQNGCL